jgi:hypothetical protein
LHAGDQSLHLDLHAKSSHSIQELSFRVGSRCDKKEFHNPCSDQLASVSAQGSVAHTLHANLEYEHQLVDALVFRVELS